MCSHWCGCNIAFCEADYLFERQLIRTQSKTTNMRATLILVAILSPVTVSAAKLSTMMPANTFIKNSQTPTATGAFVVWNEQAWHYSDDGVLRIWQHSTRTWKDLRQSVFGHIPTRRLNPSLAVSSNRLFLYGGFDPDWNSIPLSDNFYSFDAAKTMAWRKLDVAVGQTVPYARVKGGFIGSGTKIYLFGGLMNDWPSDCPTQASCSVCFPIFSSARKRCLLNDLYEFSPETEGWKALNQSQIQPCERMDFGFTAGQGKLFLLGGITLRTNVPNSIPIASWSDLNTCGVPPSDSVVLYRLQDLWSFDLVSSTWSALSAPALDVGISPGIIIHQNVLYTMGGGNGNDEIMMILCSST